MRIDGQFVSVVEANNRRVFGHAQRCGFQYVVAADEVRYKASCRTFVNLLGRRDLMDPARVENRNTIAHSHGLGLIVSDVDRRHAPGIVDGAQSGPCFFPEFRIQIRKRLIEQQQIRPDDQRSRERDALLLSA